MANTYLITDEPRGKLTHMAISPLILLLVSLFIPKPYQFLMPFVFLLNGWLMGCHNLKKQIVVVLLGGLLIAALPFAFGFVISSGVLPIDKQVAMPYFRILFNAGLFILLYKLLLLQNPIFELINYIKERTGS